MKKKEILYSFVALFGLLTGSLYCLKDSLVLTWWDTWFLAVWSLVLTVFCTLIYQKKQYTWLGLVAAILVALAGIFLRYQDISAELVKIANHVIVQINKYYRIELLPWGSLPDGNYRYVAGLLVLFFSLWLGLAVRKKKGWFVPLLSVLLCVLPGLLMGYSPSVFSVIFLLLGIGALYGKRVGADEKNEKNGQQLLVLIMLLAGFSSLLLLKPISTKLLSYHDTTKAFQLDMEDKMLEYVKKNDWFSNFYWLWGGFSSQSVLTNEVPRLTETEMFKITVETKPAQQIYIKNFIGSFYDNGVWSDVSTENFTDFATAQNMAAQECAEKLVAVTGDNIKILEQVIEAPLFQNVSIEVLVKRGNMGLIPYFTQMSPNAVYHADGGVVFDDKKQYTLKSCLDYYRLPTNLQLTAPSLETAYEAYVKEAYVALPQGQLKRLREAVKKGEYQSLLQDTVYSLELEPVAAGQDIVEYFLFEQKKGYCMHYASAATLVTRMLGIPARYVSGYVVFPNEFERNSFGTYTAVVKEKRAHAWMEIYQSGIGWSPVEATPPAYMQTAGTAQPDMALEEVVQDVEKQMHPNTQDTKQEQQKEQQKEQEKQEQEPQNEEPKPDEELAVPGKAGAGKSDSKQETAIFKMVKNILAGVLGLFLLVVLLLLRRSFVLYQQKKRFLGEDTKKAVRFITRDAFLLLQEIGYPQKDDMTEKEYAAYIQQTFYDFAENEFAKLVETARQAAYGEEPISQEMRMCAYQEYSKMKQLAQQKLAKRKLLYLRYIRIRL